MKRNSRLSLALHSVAHMASEPDRLRTSAEIAEHAQTNPVVVRRVLGKLRQAGILKAEKGHAGGWQLARAADRISVADIYLALDERLTPVSEDAPPRCSVEHALERRVSLIMDQAERDLIENLKGLSIAEARFPIDT
ncbi:Rrf2 family transcriptional regulator [Pontivivens insulae]|uniref:HTH-type transcriptional regulator YwnA n=1 Tax=Pontivivens insulae TaxID=1639689 RepID=A0A2R8A7B9_9RHOB|nr:Rrf2 family transcriptional regulator [Pontivivens insulae]RED18236.1 BadM/Rrf2 family transcriptional regulator [Pontivivens insulae]SPF28134.1 Putative HTH-type transcriptional regulator YwnA [Pontivivens insulae]